MPSIDIFRNDAFGLVEMTDAINNAQYVPSRLNEMGIFDEEPISTTSVQIEMLNGTLTLLPTVPRGAPATLAKKDKRKTLALVVPHIPYDDVIRPDDIQNVRAFGTEDELETVAGVMQRRLDNMRQRHEATHEFHRIGAWKGTILDSDGTTVLYNLFTEFGVSQTVETFALGTAGTDPVEGILNVQNAVEDAAGDMPYDHIHALCGRTWFKKFIQHPMVKDAYRQWQSGQMFQQDNRYRGFEYGGIVFEQYRGKIGGQAYVPDNDVQFAPVGAPGLFKWFKAPGDMMSTANTLGESFYARQEPLPQDKGIHVHTESNPLFICTKPAVLVRGTSSN